MAYVVSVGIGLTFTDLVAFDRDPRILICTKLPRLAARTLASFNLRQNKPSPWVANALIGSDCR